MARNNCSKKLLTLALGVIIAATQSALAGVSATLNETSPSIFTFQYAATGMPDFDQYRSVLPSGGHRWEGPAAGMNLRAYAANHGFADMELPGPGNWQSNALYDDATGAMIELGLLMNIDLVYGTDRKDWLDGLKAENGFDNSRFTRTASFLSCFDQQARIYQVMQALKMNPGLVAMLIQPYEIGQNLIWENPDICTITGANGHWQAGVPEYSFDAHFRTPWTDFGEGYDDSQSVFASEWASFDLVEVEIAGNLMGPCNATVERGTLWGGEGTYVEQFIVNGYVIVQPKAAYGFTNDPNVPIYFKLPPSAHTWIDRETGPWPTGLGNAQGLEINPDLNSFVLIAEGGVYSFSPFEESLTPILPRLFDQPKSIVFGRLRDLYVVDNAGLWRINVDAENPDQVDFTVPPNPCKQALYNDLTDQVILFSQVDRKLIRYPHDDLDAIPEVFEIPGSVPMEGDLSLALSQSDGSIWMISSNFTAVLRMVFGGGGVEAAAHVIPGIGSPPLSIDVDDAGHLFLNIGGEAREFGFNEAGQLVEVVDSPFAGLPAGAMLKVTHSRSNYTDVGFDLPPGDPPISGLSLPDCLADIEPTDGDGVVNVRDLLAVISAWGPCTACVADIAPVGGDGSVGVEELLRVIGEWGPCPELVPPLIVDMCASATLVAEGVRQFSTLQATTDGPALPVACDEGFGLSFNNDIWMLYVPTQTGTVTISTCSSANYDTRLAAYTGLCGAMTLIGCNDDGPGCAGFTSQLEVPVSLNVPVKIRLGGYGDAVGYGTVEISQD